MAGAKKTSRLYQLRRLAVQIASQLPEDTDASLGSVTAVIDKLGGPTAVGKLLKRSPQQVVNWKNDNVFPTWTYLPLNKHLRAVKCTAPMKLWRKITQAAE